MLYEDDLIIRCIAMGFSFHQDYKHRGSENMCCTSINVGMDLDAQAKCTLLIADSDGPEFTDSLEVEGGMTRVRLQESEPPPAGRDRVSRNEKRQSAS
jgi:hypothetical protein